MFRGHGVADLVYIKRANSGGSKYLYLPLILKKLYVSRDEDNLTSNLRDLPGQPSLLLATFDINTCHVPTKITEHGEQNEALLQSTS